MVFIYSLLVPGLMCQGALTSPKKGDCFFLMDFCNPRCYGSAFLEKKTSRLKEAGSFDRFLFNEGTKEDGSDDQDDTAAQTAGQLGIGDEAHTMGSTQYSKVAGTAAVCHAKTSGDGRVDGIEANELTDDCGTDDGADNNQEGDDDVAEVDGINQLVQVRIGTTPTMMMRTRQELMKDCRRLAAAFVAFGTIPVMAAMVTMMIIQAKG